MKCIVFHVELLVGFSKVFTKDVWFILLTAIENVAVKVFSPSKELEVLAKPADVMAGIIQPSTVSAISKTFNLNSEEVLRWIASK